MNSSSTYIAVTTGPSNTKFDNFHLQKNIYLVALVTFVTKVTHKIISGTEPVLIVTLSEKRECSGKILLDLPEMIILFLELRLKLLPIPNTTLSCMLLKKRGQQSFIDKTTTVDPTYNRISLNIYV